MPQLRNGIGTAYFGASDRRPDGSFVTTKWFVLLDVPLIPLGSTRVRHLGATDKVFKKTDSYEIIERAPLDGKMVGAAYLWLLATIVFLAGVAWLCLVDHRLLRSLGIPVSGKLGMYATLGAFIADVLFWQVVFPKKYKAA